MPEKFETGSEQWFDALREETEKALAGVDLTGVQVAFSEELLDPPAHLLAAGETSVAWTVKVGEGGVEVSRGRIADPDFYLEADYTAISAIAGLTVADPELHRIMGELEAEGLLRRGGDGSKMPPQVGAAWGRVHDAMTERTL